MTTSPGAPSDQDYPDNPWPGLWAMIVGFFMILVDATIVSIGTPALMRAFEVDITTVLWVTSSYLLAYAVPLLVTGRLGDRYGPKALYLVGLAIFTGASLWCGLSGSITGLIIARAVQGLGAAIMTPQTMSVITRTFRPERRGQAMALWGATAGVATLVGPILGGVLIDSLGWEWMFFINVPIGLVDLFVASRLIPHLGTTEHSVDWVGVALSAVGLFCAVFGIQEGETYHWGTITGIISVPLLIGLGGLFLLAFIWWQSRVRSEPLIPLSLFRDRNFSLSNVAVTAMGVAITAMMFPFNIYAQTVRGLTPTMAALLLAPQAVMSILLARWAGNLTDRVPPRILAGLGLGGFTATAYLLSRIMTPESPTWQILGVAVLMGTSSSFIWGPLAVAATRNLPRHLAGAGSGVYNTTRQMGSVVGSAAIAALMTSRIAAHMPQAAGSAGGGSMEPAPGTSLPAQLLDPFSAALSDAMLLPAGVLLLGTLAALFLETPRHMRGGPAEGAPVAPH